MANRVEGVTEKLLECAKEEFLKNGYENASLRMIADKADSSKGAIYIRYPDKESLYRAIVQPAAQGLLEMMSKGYQYFERLPADEQKAQINTTTDISGVVDYIYEYFDEFRILLTSGETTIAQEFMHAVVDIDVEGTLQYIEATENDAISSGRLTLDLAHLLSSAFYSGFFEIVVHNMPIEEAKQHISRMSLFYKTGWNTIFIGDATDKENGA